MNRRNKLGTILMVLVLLTFLLPSAAEGSVVPEAGPLQEQPTPLPRDCDDVTPRGGLPPKCCVYGYVYYQDQPAAGASVRIASAHGLLDATTATGSASGSPFFSADLSAGPLLAAPGDTITLTGSLDGVTSVRTWTVQSDGQQVDLGLVGGQQPGKTAGQQAGQGGEQEAKPAALAESAAGPWPMFHHDAAHSGRTSYVGPARGSVLWTYQTGGTVSSPAIDVNGGIYVGSTDGSLYALRANGTLKWSYATGGPVESSPALDEAGNVYFGSTDGYLYAVKPDGSLNWRYPAGASIPNAPTLGLDGTIYFTAFDGKLYILNPGGSLRCFYQADGVIGTSPAVGADGVIYVGSGNANRLHAVNPDCSLKWKSDPPHANGVGGSPSLSDDGTVVYYGAEDGHVYARHTADGSLKWESPHVYGGSRSSPAVGADGTVYAGTLLGNLWALDPDDGTTIWDVNVAANAGTSPAVDAEGTIYFATDYGFIFARHPDGSEKWTGSGGGHFQSSPAIGPDGVLYVGSTDGKLYAFGETPGWPMFRYDYSHTGRGAHPGPEQATVRWTFQAGGEVNSSPAVDRYGGIFVGSDDGNLYAINPDGTLRWTYLVGGLVHSSPAIARDGTVIVGSTNGTVVGVRPDGTPLWTYTTAGEVYSSPTVAADGTIWIGSTAGFLYALDSSGGLRCSYSAGGAIMASPAVGRDGVVYIGSGNENRLHAVNPDCSLKWKSDPPHGNVLNSSPALSPDGTTVYYGADDGYLYARYTADGSLKWTSPPTYGGVQASPAVGADGTVYIGTQYGYLWALNPADGTLMWDVYTTLSAWASPAVDSEGAVYFATDYGYIFARYPDGAEKWTYSGPGHFRSSPAIGMDGTLYVGSTDGKLYAFGPSAVWPMFRQNPRHDGRSEYVGPSSGSVLWTYPTGGQVTSSPAIDYDGTIYVGSRDGTLYALNPAGTLKWSYPTGGEIQSSPAIGLDGTIYVGSGDGYLYALRRDGTLKWRHQTEGGIGSSPVLGSDGAIYLGSTGQLHAFNPDGTLRCEYVANGTVTSTPVIGADGVLYFGSGNENRLHAVNPDCTLKWKSDPPQLNVVSTSPALSPDDSTVYYGADDGYFYARRTSDGSLKWTSPYAYGGVQSSAAVGADGTVYVGTQYGNLWALNPDDGSLLWDVYTTLSVAASPAIDAEGTIYFATAYGYLFALRPDGTEKWRYQPDHDVGHFFSSPAIGANRTLYVGSTDYNLYAFGELPAAPVAAFDAAPVAGVVPLTVQFNDRSSGSVTAWSWSFGDGGVSGGRYPAHVYDAAGTYDVALTAAGPGGSDTELKSAYISAQPDASPPVASIDYIWWNEPPFPSPPRQGLDRIYFAGSGHDTDENGAYLIGYRWSSSLDGPLSTQSSFLLDAAELSAGAHTITFQVLDDEGVWSTPVTALLTVAPPPAEVRTLILTNGQRFETLYGAPQAAQVRAKLDALALDADVQGQVVDLQSDATVAAAYAAWDAEPASTARANAVSEAVKQLLDAYWAGLPALEYLVIAGDDRIIPFHRVPDRSSTTESNYATVSADSTVGAALHDDQVLTDDYYADAEPTALEGAGWDDHGLYLPDLGIGRLIETPAEIGAQITLFLAGSDVPASPAIVTGYGPVGDGAWQICEGLAGAGLSLDCSLIGDAWGFDGFTSQVLNKRHTLVSINGHADHFTFETPWGEINSTDLAEAQADHAQALFYTLGCHSGLNVPPTDAYEPLDLAQAAVQSGALYVGNTGYGFASASTLGWSEQLMLLFSQKLVQGQSATAGQSLAIAKQEYYLADGGFDHEDEKILIESTLYGLPMVRYTTARTGGAEQGAKGEAPDAARLLARPAMPDGLTVSQVSYRFPALTLEQTINGQYLTLDGQVHTGIGEPLQPQLTADLSRPGTLAHGVVLEGAVYADRSSFDPVIDQALTGPTVPPEPAFSAPGWYPTRLATLNRAERGDGVVALLGQFNPVTGVERVYDRLDLAVYYHTDTADWTPPTIGSVQAERFGGSGHVHVTAADASGIEAVVVACTDGAGTWTGTHLTLLGESWSGLFPAGPTTVCLVQAVDKAGNVAVGDNGGLYYQLTATQAHTSYLPVVTRNP